MSAAATIEIRNVHKAFGSGVNREEVFTGVNLVIPQGSITYVLGPSGAGKSVLLKHIVGLMRPDRGDIRILGRPIPYLRSGELNDLRKKFGVLFQGAALFDNMTVSENIAFPLIHHRRKMPRSEMWQVVRNILVAVGLDPAVTMDKYPNELSGGMKKRVGLARAIVLSPQILLYDEPTTGLDPINRLNVEDMIVSTNRRFGLTSMVISHDVAAALRLADLIAFLYSGKVVFFGNTREFRHSPHPVVREFLRAEDMHWKELAA